MKYLEAAARKPSTEYRRVLDEALHEGVEVETRQDVPARTVMQQVMRFDLRNGFPLITERDLSRFWQKPIGELCAFINGATTLAELEEFGCDWWGPWATPEKSAKIGAIPGRLGWGSYGAAFNSFPTGNPVAWKFDQFKHLVEQIKELPDLRTHFITPWIPQANVRGKGKTPGTTISPCHGWVHVRVLNGKLHLHMFQRSGDLPVGVPANMVQYAALLLMLEHLTGYEAGTYYHTISDAHIYENQVAAVEQMLETFPARKLPQVHLTEEGKKVKDIYGFRGHHFELSEYEPYPAIKIPVAV